MHSACLQEYTQGEAWYAWCVFPFIFQLDMKKLSFSTQMFGHKRLLMQDNNNSSTQPLRETWTHKSRNPQESYDSTHTLSSPLCNAYTVSSPLQLSCQVGGGAQRASRGEEGGRGEQQKSTEALQTNNSPIVAHHSTAVSAQNDTK